MCHVSPEVQLVLSSQNNIYVVPKHSDLNELFAETEQTRKAVKTRLPGGIVHYLQNTNKEEVERFCQLIANGVKSQLGMSKDAKAVYLQTMTDFTAFVEDINKLIQIMVSAIRGAVQSVRSKQRKQRTAQRLMEMYAPMAA